MSIFQEIKNLFGLGESGQQSNFDPNNVLPVNLSQIKNLLDEFSMEQLISICQDLNIDYQQLTHHNKMVLSVELVQYLRRRERASELTDWLSKNGRKQIGDALNHHGPIETNF